MLVLKSCWVDHLAGKMGAQRTKKTGPHLEQDCLIPREGLGGTPELHVSPLSALTFNTVPLFCFSPLLSCSAGFLRPSDQAWMKLRL